MRIDEVVPAHAGLGSGTQIALGGRSRRAAVPRTAARCARRCHPARARRTLGGRHRTIRSWRSRRRWRTRTAHDGRAGRQSNAFPGAMAHPGRAGSAPTGVCMGRTSVKYSASFAPSSDAEAAHLCRLVLMKALPALAECDIAGFGSAIKEMQVLLGDYFAAIQGGSRFSSPDVAAALDVRSKTKVRIGIGQSSWGPTGFAFAPSAEEANRLVESVYRHPRYRDLDIRTVAVSIAEHTSSVTWRRTSLSDTKDKTTRPGGDAMTDKHILHMLTPLKHMSPFDVNMALDAGYDAAIPYTNVDARRSRRPGTGRDLLAPAQDRRREPACSSAARMPSSPSTCSPPPRRRWCRRSASHSSPTPQGRSPPRRRWWRASRRS